MSSDSETTISRRISQRSETETESEAIVLPQTEKLPQLDQFDPNFEELHDVPEGMILFIYKNEFFEPNIIRFVGHDVEVV